MKTRNIILGMLLFAFSACTPENKSVTEPLTPEETEEIDKKYPGFSYNYETYIYPKVNKLSKSSSFYLKLKKLTYADFMDFIQKQLQLHESKWEKQAEEKAIQEWNKKFDIEKLTHRLDAMTDSIITSWENYYKENNLNTYLSIELLEMNKTIVNDSYTGMSSLNATVHLKVTPLKGRIDKLSVGSLSSGPMKFHLIN